jgi:hypothetical protein
MRWYHRSFPSAIFVTSSSNKRRLPFDFHVTLCGTCWFKSLSLRKWIKLKWKSIHV